MSKPVLTLEDGGPAFPRPSYGPNEPADGMSLRDWFAGQALPGYLAGNPEYHVSAAEAAEQAYAYADAMIASRLRAVSQP